MPAYNTAKFISAAIESILNQSFNNFKFIINNGSTDETENIIKKYANGDKRIVLLNNKKIAAFFGIEL